MQKIKRFRPTIIMVVLIILTIVISLNACNPGIFIADPVDSIRTYARKHDQFTFEEALNFKWDVVYLDTQVYGYGENIKEKYDLEFNVGELWRDHYRRLLFFRDGKLVKECQYEFYYFQLPTEIDRIFPDMTFACQWEKGNEYGERLVLGLLY